MLWAKESNKKNALFVDLFQLNKLQRTLNLIESKACSPPQKSDSVALRKRKEGNVLFGQRDWIEAMEMYNESLCFAKPGSKHISLAYANRSSCFLNMKLYNECLIDIELAKASGYPSDLMNKLDQRKEECLKRMKEDVTLGTFEPKLSYETNEKFPCMANVLEFKQGADGENLLCAKDDIDVGQTIIVESAFIKYLIRSGRKCSICLKGNANLIPCECCATAMFCGDECQNNFLHKYECGLKYSEDDSLNGGMLEATRAILLGVNAFATVDELMKFVEDTVKSDPNELPDSLIDELSKYRAFLKLPTADDDEGAEIFTALVYCTYKFILNIPEMKVTFESEKHRRFLMHLVSHCMKVTSKNSFQELAVIRRKEYAMVYSQTGIVTKYLEHSCAPNATITQTNGNLICVTIRPVKKGGRVYISLFELLLESKEKRQRELWENKQIRCKCRRCEGRTATLDQRKQIASDQDVLDIISNYPVTISEVNKLPQLIANCETVSRKYGDVEWCDELGRVINIYIKLLNLRMSGFC